MNTRASVLYGCAALMVFCASSKGQNAVNTPTPGGVTATDVVPGGPAPSDPTRFEDHSGAAGIPNTGAMAKYTAAGLQDTLGLTVAQARQIELILSQESGDIQMHGGVRSPDFVIPAQLHARSQIRALLTPEQRAQYNLIPWYFGGGLVGLSPWVQLDQLDRLAHLTSAQKKAALEIYIEGTETLMENRAPKPTAQTRETRFAVRKEIRALLTPEQQKIWDATPVKKGGGDTVTTTEHQLEHLDSLVHLTSEEKPVALQIFQEENAELLKFPAEERADELPDIRLVAVIEIHAILSPEQQQIMDAALEKHRARSKEPGNF